MVQGLALHVVNQGSIPAYGPLNFLRDDPSMERTINAERQGSGQCYKTTSLIPQGTDAPYSGLGLGGTQKSSPVSQTCE